MCIRDRVFENVFPFVRKSRKLINSKSWFNEDCLKAFKKKTKLYKKYTKTQNEIDRIALYNHNKYYKKLIKFTKNDYNMRLISECEGDCKATWKFINNILGKKRDLRAIKLINDGQNVNEEDIPNIFNEFFNKVGHIYGNHETSIHDHQKFMTNRQVSSFYFEQINLEEVLKIVSNFNCKKSSTDIIPTKLFQTYPISILDRLTTILNKCILDGVMPQKLKMSRIIPIYKNGKRTNYNNYRPISLLSYIDKILEKAIHTRIYSYLTKINFFCNNQFGFRHKHSTEHAILSLMERIYKHIDVSEYVILISIDLRKAFDVIRHDILLSKLEHIGIRGHTLSWFKSFLEDRPHCTYANSKCSDYLNMKTGVPQGSCLGPLLFLIYMNDIRNSIDENYLNMFADDTTIILHATDKNYLIELANTTLVLLDKFLTANAVRINESKCEYMLVCPKGKSIYTHEPVFYKNVPLREVNAIKFLGVYIDKKLNFTNHTEKLIKKLRKYIAIFYKIRRFVTKKHMLLVYHSNVCSLISYCLLVYGRGNTQNLDRIERLQKRILKIILSKSNAEINMAMKKNKLLSLRNLLKYKLLCLGYQIVNNATLIPSFLKDKYQCKKDLGLRNKLDFIKPYYRSNIGQRCIDYQLSIEWKDVPHNLKSLINYKLFKKKMKEELLTNLS